MKPNPLRLNDAKQIKKVRKILKSMGYLKPNKVITEQQRVKMEGRYWYGQSDTEAVGMV
jgi:ribosomal protein S8